MRAEHFVSQQPFQRPMCSYQDRNCGLITVVYDDFIIKASLNDAMLLFPISHSSVPVEFMTLSSTFRWAWCKLRWVKSSCVIPPDSLRRAYCIRHNVSWCMIVCVEDWMRPRLTQLRHFLRKANKTGSATV